MTREVELTTPDLVVLAFLKQQPMHGYELNEELERCEVKDWAGVSRPQVYYSLKKLLGAKLIRPKKDRRPAAGPERRVYEVTGAGGRGLANALEKTSWATCRGVPPFLTWMALCPHAKPRAVKKLVAERRAFLEAEIRREKETITAVESEAGPDARRVVLMIELVVRQMEIEVEWLAEVEEKLVQG